MPDADLPADLVALQQAWEDAHAATMTFVTEVEARRRSGTDITPWTSEEDEQLDRLRDQRETARKALWGHPAIVAAQLDGTWKALHTQLKIATGAEGWAVKGK